MQNIAKCYSDASKIMGKALAKPFSNFIEYQSMVRKNVSPIPLFRPNLTHYPESCVCREGVEAYAVMPKEAEYHEREVIQEEGKARMPGG